MSIHALASTRKASALKASSVSAGLLQRQCACGNHTPAGGECERCTKDNASLQRHNSLRAVPPIVHDTLRSGGQPLDEAPRQFMERRFGHDFSRVRVHSDSQARDAAQAVDAHAFTVGQSIVFGGERYAPSMPAGLHLLAHELAHTMQQSGAPGARQDIEIGGVGDPAESEADVLAHTALRGGRLGYTSSSVLTTEAPKLRRQSTQPKKEPKCLVRMGDYCLDVAPQFPDLPIKPPTLKNIETGLDVLKGGQPGGQKSPAGSPDCSIFPGFSPGGGDFSGQCCSGPRNPHNCCLPEMIAIAENRCCPGEARPQDGVCRKAPIHSGVQPGDKPIPKPDKPPLQDAPERILPQGQEYA